MKRAVTKDVEFVHEDDGDFSLSFKVNDLDRHLKPLDSAKMSNDVR